MNFNFPAGTGRSGLIPASTHAAVVAAGKDGASSVKPNDDSDFGSMIREATQPAAGSKKGVVRVAMSYKQGGGTGSGADTDDKVASLSQTTDSKVRAGVESDTVAPEDLLIGKKAERKPGKTAEDSVAAIAATAHAAIAVDVKPAASSKIEAAKSSEKGQIEVDQARSTQSGQSTGKAMDPPGIVRNDVSKTTAQPPKSGEEQLAKSADDASDTASLRLPAPSGIKPARNQAGSADTAVGQATDILSLVKDQAVRGEGKSGIAKGATEARKAESQAITNGLPTPSRHRAAADLSPAGFGNKAVFDEKPVVQQNARIPTPADNNGRAVVGDTLKTAVSRSTSSPGKTVNLAAGAFEDAPKPVVAGDGTAAAVSPKPASMHVSALAMAAAQSSGKVAVDAPLALGSGASPASVETGQGEKKAGAADGAAREVARGITPDSVRDAAPAPASALVASSPTLHAPTAVSASLPAVNLAGALGQQAIDLGVSGQWINAIARQIASISANPGHGSFRIEAQTLGAVRVDIAPGALGSEILMTVDNDAAKLALTKDRDRLLLDSRAASVRIGDLRIERVTASSEAHRGDMGNTSQNGGGSSGQAGSQASMAQNSGQSGQGASRHDGAALAGERQDGNNPKASFTRSVLDDAASSERDGRELDGRTDTARYA